MLAEAEKEKHDKSSGRILKACKINFPVLQEAVITVVRAKLIPILVKSNLHFLANLQIKEILIGVPSSGLGRGATGSERGRGKAGSK